MVTPVSLAGFLFIIFRFSSDLVEPQSSGFLTWYRICYFAWTLIFMPMLATLLGVLSWDLEDEAGAWRHRRLQPVPRWAHYAARLLGLGSLVLLANLIFLLSVLAGGLLLRSGAPDIEMGEVAHIRTLLRLAGSTCIASMPLLALWVWLPSRLHGMGLNLGITLFGCLLAFRTASTSMFGMILPWGWISQVVGMVLEAKGSLLWAFWGSMASTLILGFVGLLDASRLAEPLRSGGAS